MGMGSEGYLVPWRNLIKLQNRPPSFLKKKLSKISQQVMGKKLTIGAKLPS